MRILFIRNICSPISHSQISYGLGIVATIAHNAGYKVKVIDNNTPYKFYRDKDFIRVINSFKPDVLAYSMTLFDAYEAYQQIRKFKALFPNLIVVSGGIHMKHCFEEALRHGVDIVVNREGEKVILPLLRHLEKKGKDGYKRGLESIPGISFVKEDKSFYFAKEFPALKNLDKVPSVNYELFNIDDFIKTKTESGIFYINGQRGCPFSCKFCSDEIQRADKRVSSANWLFKNAVYLYKKYKVRYLLIADNNITLFRQRLVDFCNKMIKSGLNEKITFSCQTTVRFPIDEELLSLMKKAGFGRINFGVERLTPYSLKKINKVQSIENVYKVLSSVSKLGMDPSVFMMIGFPFENRKLLQQEKKLFLGLTKYTKRLWLSVLAPTPGTIYYDNNPKLKEWYLNKKEHLMFRAYFTHVLGMHTFHTIKRNFFDLPEETQKAIKDYYLTFKKIDYGSVFTKKNIILSGIMKFDFLIAKLSQAVFATSPSLEFFMFNRLKAIRYYWGNYFFSSNLLDE